MSLSEEFNSKPTEKLCLTLQLAQKYDPQREHELRQWIEEVTGKRIGENFMESLKDGVILCE